MKKIYSLFALLMFSAVAFGGTIAPAHQGKVRSTAATPANNSAVRLAPSGKNRTAAAFWSDDFSNAANWNRTATVGTDNWVIGTTGPSGAYSIAAITSATATNGFAMFDSDLLCSGNQTANLTNVNPINCTGHSAVRLTFSQYYRHYVDSTFLFVSNNGTTWNKIVINSPLLVNGYSGGSAGVNPDIKSIDISAYAANQATVYIRFQFYSPNTLGTGSGCGYAWMIDDVSLEEPIADDVALAVAGFVSEYSCMPILQAGPLAPNARIYNNGGSAAANVSASVEIFDGNFNSVFQDITNSVSSLNAGDTTAVLTTTSTYIPVDTGIYYIMYVAQMTNLDGNTSNDTAFQFVYVDDSTYARDYTYLDVNSYAGGFGFNGISGSLGQKFHIYTSSQFTSATFYLANATLGDHLTVDVYDMASGMPNTQIGTTGNYTISPSDTGGAFVTLAFNTPINVSAGNDYFVAVQQVDTNNLTLGASNDIFSLNSVMYNISGTWGTVESQGIPICFILRPNNPSSTAVGISNVDLNSNVMVYPNPSKGVLNILNNGAFDKNVTVTVMNNVGQTIISRNFSSFSNERIDLGNQADGVYTVKITDAKNTVVKNIVISNK